MEQGFTSYPARLSLEADLRIARWRPLVNWLLAIPQLIVSQVLRRLRGILILISFFTVLFTTRIPRGIFDVIAMTYRYQWRVTTFALWMREQYPPFDFTPAADDTRTDPAVVTIDYPDRLHRWLPLVKWLLALPHLVALAVLWALGLLIGVFAFFAVLFTGAYPRAMRDYLVGVSRWGLRVKAYAGLLTDQYPPFSLS